MDINLHRFRYSAQGIFSYLFDEGGGQVAVCVSHAYEIPPASGTYLPVVPHGTYKCVRGTHQLEGGSPFTTFEITGVAGHTGVLFHPGNTELDSRGCECLGTALGDILTNEGMLDAVLNSREAFQQFLLLQKDVDEFWLKVD